MPGTAIFLTSDPEVVPTALMHNLKHNKVLHEKNVVMNVRTAQTPRVDDADRVQIERLSRRLQPGDPDLRLHGDARTSPRRWRSPAGSGLKFDIMSTSFFLGRRSIQPAAKSAMPLWQDKLFISLARRAANASDFFNIPAGPGGGAGHAGDDLTPARRTDGGWPFGNGLTRVSRACC